MTWLIGGNDLSDQIQDEFLIHMDFLELDGHQIDFEVVEFESLSEFSVDVYVDEKLAGRARSFDDLAHIVDTFFEEGADN